MFAAFPFSREPEMPKIPWVLPHIPDARPPTHAFGFVPRPARAPSQGIVREKVRHAPARRAASASLATLPAAPAPRGAEGAPAPTRVPGAHPAPACPLRPADLRGRRISAAASRVRQRRGP